MDKSDIVIEDDIAKGLATLAGNGRTASDLANDVLRSFVEDADTSEDDRRMREYERTGAALSGQQFFDLLDRLEARATEKMNSL